MFGMPLNLQEKGILQQEAGTFWVSKKRKGFEGSEPRSVLDTRRSPSQSTTSSSTLSSSLGGSSDTVGVAAVIPGGDDKSGMVVEDWETMLSMPAAPVSPTHDQEQTFFQWIMAENDDPSSAGPFTQHQQLVEFDCNTGGFGMADQGFGIDPIGAMGGGPALASPTGFPPMNSNLKGPAHFGNPPSNHFFPPSGVLYQETMEDNKQLFFGPGLVMNQHQQSPFTQNPAFFVPMPPFAAATHHDNHQLLHAKRQQAAVVEPTCQIPPNGPHQQMFTPQMNAAPPYHLQIKTKAAGDDMGAQQQPPALVDQLFKAAELIEAGNPVSARLILARLNQLLPSPVGKPLQRSAFYFKEALHNITNSPTPTPLHRAPATPLDVLLKLRTYKAFSEVSPVLQFTNFTSIQAILEELGCSDRIHIIDFDISFGGQWSSFMQELAQRWCSSGASSGTSPFLKITAFASPSAHHPLELYLTRENLSHFARDLNIPFEFNVLSLDPFDTSMLLSLCAGVDEAVAVNLPVGCAYYPPISTLLRTLKQLSPKIVVSVDHGCDRGELSFSHQFLHAFQSCTVLLDSIDAAGINLDVSNKIERFLVQPRIENALLGRHSAGDKNLPWRSLFATAGFVPVQFSNFAETQAECLVKRVPVTLRGFHVEKRQASLFLCWQRDELVSVSAWRC